MKIGGQFCCSFVAYLLQYLYAKNCRNILWFDKVIAKIKRVQFFLPQQSRKGYYLSIVYRRVFYARQLGIAMSKHCV